MPKAAAKPEPTARVLDQEYELVDVDELKEHPDNDNVGNTDAVRASIRVNGFYNAIKAQRSTGYVLAGNTSFRAAKLEGLEAIPTIWLDVDPVGAIRILLADNQTARLAEANQEATDKLLEQLGSLEGTGFDFAPVVEAEEQEAAEEAEREREAAEEASEGDEEVPDGLEGTQYGVVVMIENEDAQQELYNEMKQRGYKCRVVSV